MFDDVPNQILPNPRGIEALQLVQSVVQQKQDNAIAPFSHFSANSEEEEEEEEEEE